MRLGRWLLEAAHGPQRARVCGIEAVQDGRDGRLAGVASVVSVVSVVVFPGRGAHLRAPLGVVQVECAVVAADSFAFDAS